jgi:hypothetical protein
MKILSINNLMPAEIKYEIDGKTYDVVGYIDYRKCELAYLADGLKGITEDVPSGFPSHVSEYLREFLARQNFKLDKPLPPEIREKMQQGASYKAEDYIPHDLTVELVKAKDGKIKN